MSPIVPEYLDYPIFIWEGLVSTASTLITSVVLALIATFYLRKRDERTRIAGVVLEKRINGEQEILTFLENATYTVQMSEPQASRYVELLRHFDLPAPHAPRAQYAGVFESKEEFHRFQQDFERLIAQHRLVLSEKVRFHLTLIQGYLSWLNAGLLISRRVPVPSGYELTDDDQQIIEQKMLLLQALAFDDEIKGLIAHLEVLMVDSVFRLDLHRPKKSIMRNGFWNRDSKKIIATLSDRTHLGRFRESIVSLALFITAQLKGFDPTDEMISSFVDGFVSE